MIGRALREVKTWVEDLFEGDYEKPYRAGITAKFARRFILPVSYCPEKGIYLSKDLTAGKVYQVPSVEYPAYLDFLFRHELPSVFLVQVVFPFGDLFFEWDDTFFVSYKFYSGFESPEDAEAAVLKGSKFFSYLEEKSFSSLGFEEFPIESLLNLYRKFFPGDSVYAGEIPFDRQVVPDDFKALVSSGSVLVPGGRFISSMTLKTFGNSTNIKEIILSLKGVSDLFSREGLSGLVSLDVRPGDPFSSPSIYKKVSSKLGIFAVLITEEDENLHEERIKKARERLSSDFIVFQREMMHLNFFFSLEPFPLLNVFERKKEFGRHQFSLEGL